MTEMTLEPAPSTRSAGRREPRIEYAEDTTGPYHHLIFTQAGGCPRDGDVRVASHWNGNLRAYGALVPATCVVLPEDRSAGDDRSVPLDASLRPLLLRGFTARGLARRARLYWRARKTIRRLVAEASFVQIQHVASFGFMAGLAAIEFGKPFYLDLGGTLRDPPGVSVPRPWHTRLARIYYRRAEERLAKFARLVIAVNTHLHETFPATNAPKAIVSHSMVEANEVFLRDDACAGPSFRLFVATRMIESKGLQHLMRAVRLLVDQGVPLTLDLAGEGVFQPRLKALAAELRLGSHVVFLGGVPGGDRLWSLYRKADIVVLPSLGHYEGTPRMIIEAWAAGAPVVATTVGGIPSMVRHGADGLLVAPGDAAALADAVRRLIDDAPLRRRLVGAGYARARELTYEGRLPLLKDAFEKYLPGLMQESVA